jgi:trk system potassium uptake protein TrkA
LNTKPNLLIAYIIRNKKLIIPSGQDVIKPNDRVIVVTKEKNYDDIDDIVY